MNTNLLYRYISGDTTEEERKHVVEWLDAEEANMKEYIKLRRAYDALVWVDEVDSSYEKEKPNRHVSLWFGRIAVVLVIALLSIFIYNQYNSQKPDKEQMLAMIIPAGQYGELVLADSSRVWLNSGSKLKFPSQFISNTREVYLEGEAFFEVAADKDCPFIVHTKDFSVKALGTKFNINSFSNGDKSTTSLLSGKVNIKLKHSGEAYNLTPNHELEYEKGQIRLKLISNLSRFEWRNGIINFENEAMSTLLEELGRYYGVKVEVKNTNILGDKYTGKFKIKDGIEQALRVLQLRSDFVYEKVGDHIVIE